MDHPFILFPNAQALADALLVLRGFPSTSEQMALADRAGLESHLAYSHGDINRERSYSEMLSAYSHPDAIRDLKILSEGPNPMDIPAELEEVKRNYNTLIEKLIKASPGYLDLAWQIYRRRGHLDRIHSMHTCTIENILNPEGPSESKEFIVPSPRTDEERIRQAFAFTLPPDTEEILKTKPKYRLVEFNPNYFYRTGRCAFANEQGDIFQTIWDVRDEHIPLFHI